MRKLFDEAREHKTAYEPYKYVMQDTGSLYLGAKLSYAELLSLENTPFKLKAILTQYIFKERDPETTLESEFYHLSGEGFVYETYLQLKIRCKVMEQQTTRGLFGRKKTTYREASYSLKELVSLSPAEKENRGMLISEVIVSKLALSAFTV